METNHEAPPSELLSEEQTSALETVDEIFVRRDPQRVAPLPQAMFVTGAGGTGKSFLLRAADARARTAIVDHLPLCCQRNAMQRANASTLRARHEEMEAQRAAGEPEQPEDGPGSSQPDAMVVSDGAPLVPTQTRRRPPRVPPVVPLVEPVVKLAPTAVAALHVGGVTVDKHWGIHCTSDRVVGGATGGSCWCPIAESFVPWILRDEARACARMGGSRAIGTSATDHAHPRTLVSRLKKWADMAAAMAMERGAIIDECSMVSGERLDRIAESTTLHIFALAQLCHVLVGPRPWLECDAIYEVESGRPAPTTLSEADLQHARRAVVPDADAVLLALFSDCSERVLTDEQGLQALGGKPRPLQEKRWLAGMACAIVRHWAWSLLASTRTGGTEVLALHGWGRGRWQTTERRQVDAVHDWLVRRVEVAWATHRAAMAVEQAQRAEERALCSVALDELVGRDADTAAARIALQLVAAAQSAPVVAAPARAPTSNAQFCSMLAGDEATKRAARLSAHKRRSEKQGSAFAEVFGGGGARPRPTSATPAERPAKRSSQFWARQRGEGQQKAREMRTVTDKATAALARARAMLRALVLFTGPPQVAPQGDGPSPLCGALRATQRAALPWCHLQPPAFGNMALLFVGDLYQLPPVRDSERRDPAGRTASSRPTDTSLFRFTNDGDLFQSDTWVRLNPSHHVLTVNQRCRLQRPATGGDTGLPAGGAVAPTDLSGVLALLPRHDDETPDTGFASALASLRMYGALAGLWTWLHKQPTHKEAVRRSWPNVLVCAMEQANKRLQLVVARINQRCLVAAPAGNGSPAPEDEVSGGIALCPRVEDVEAHNKRMCALVHQIATRGDRSPAGQGGTGPLCVRYGVAHAQLPPGDCDTVTVDTYVVRGWWAPEGPFPVRAARSPGPFPADDPPMDAGTAEAWNGHEWAAEASWYDASTCQHTEESSDDEEETALEEGAVPPTASGLRQPAGPRLLVGRVRATWERHTGNLWVSRVLGDVGECDDRRTELTDRAAGGARRSEGADGHWFAETPEDAPTRRRRPRRRRGMAVDSDSDSDAARAAHELTDDEDDATEGLWLESCFAGAPLPRAVSERLRDSHAVAGVWGDTGAVHPPLAPHLAWWLRHTVTSEAMERMAASSALFAMVHDHAQTEMLRVARQAGAAGLFALDEDEGRTDDATAAAPTDHNALFVRPLAPASGPAAAGGAPLPPVRGPGVPELNLVVGGPILMTHNVDFTKGFVNGRSGRLADFVPVAEALGILGLHLAATMPLHHLPGIRGIDGRTGQGREQRRLLRWRFAQRVACRAIARAIDRHCWRDEGVDAAPAATALTGGGHRAAGGEEYDKEETDLWAAPMDQRQDHATVWSATRVVAACMEEAWHRKLLTPWGGMVPPGCAEELGAEAPPDDLPPPSLLRTLFPVLAHGHWLRTTRLPWGDVHAKRRLRLGRWDTCQLQPELAELVRLWWVGVAREFVVVRGHTLAPFICPPAELLAPGGASAVDATQFTSHASGVAFVPRVDIDPLAAASGGARRDGRDDALPSPILVLPIPQTVTRHCPVRLGEVAGPRVRVSSGDVCITTVETRQWVMPIVPRWGLTVHRAQGLTLPSVTVHRGKNFFEAGQAYVCVSRVCGFDGLAIATSALAASDFVAKPDTALYLVQSELVKRATVAPDRPPPHTMDALKWWTARDLAWYRAAATQPYPAQSWQGELSRTGALPSLVHALRAHHTETIKR